MSLPPWREETNADSQPFTATLRVDPSKYLGVAIDNVEFEPRRRFPITMPRWERRRMTVERDKERHLRRIWERADPTQATTETAGKDGQK